MHIRILKGTFHLGYAYRAGDTTKSLPDDEAKKLVAGGYAVPVELKKRPVKPEKAEVQTTDIRKKK